jgi:CheY-like chemotaxis protein
VEEAGTEPGNGELILAVEDDPKVRRLTIARLGQLGYRVLEAASGREALDVLVANPNVDLLFTDLVMPGGMSGLELSIEAQKRFPHLKTLLTSGYAEDLALGDRPERAHLRLLRKPYRLADLAAAVSETLGG